MDPFSALSALELAGAIIGVVGGIFTSTYGIYKGIKFIARLHRAKIAKDAEESEMRNNVREIFKQVKPNGGSSMRDAIDNIDSRLYRLEEQVSLGNQVSNLILLDAGLSVFETNQAGDFTNANRTLQLLVGRTKEELLHRGWIVSIASHDTERVWHEFYDCVSDEREYHSHFMMVHSDGEQFNVRCAAFPLRNREGEVTGYMGFIRRVDDVNASPYRRS